MLKLAVTFLVVALVLALLGFGGIAGALVEIAIILFWIALAIAVILFVLGYLAARKIGGR